MEEHTVEDYDMTIEGFLDLDEKPFSLPKLREKKMQVF